MSELVLLDADEISEIFSKYLGHRRERRDDSGNYCHFPGRFNPKAIRESARIKPDLHNQVRRFSSGMTLVSGGRMRLPANWGSGRE
ncbi:hypothetical protein [Gluconobacter oxydans]|uniref:hypothetical protein n=1 Tax=Gluconobacter oxydans TaxID=442 RepID=UPI0039EB5125